MRFQFLPHYFKYVGLVLYFGLGVFPSADDFVAGFNAARTGAQVSLPDHLFGLPDFLFSQGFQAVHLLGILLYALAKDKVFDEFMIKLRMESLYIVFFVTLIFILLRVILFNDWEMSAMYLLEAQIVFFLILNKVRKHTVAA